MRDYEQALNVKLKYEPQNDPYIASSYENLGGLYHKKGEYVKAIEMYDKAIEIRRCIQLESHPDIESIVYTRNSLQEYTKNHPGEIFEYDSSSEEEPMFQSLQEACNYIKKQMKPNEDEN